MQRGSGRARMEMGMGMGEGGGKILRISRGEGEVRRGETKGWVCGLFAEGLHCIVVQLSSVLLSPLGRRFRVRACTVCWTYILPSSCLKHTCIHTVTVTSYKQPLHTMVHTHVARIPSYTHHLTPPPPTLLPTLNGRDAAALASWCASHRWHLAS